MTLLQVSREIGAPVELQTLLERIELAALKVLHCERVAVFLHDPRTHTLHTTLATGAPVIRLPSGHGIVGAAFTSRTVINVPDAYADPRFFAGADQNTRFRTRNLLAVPLTGYDGQVVGVLEVLNKRVGAFSPSDEDLAVTLGSLTGAALQRQMLLDQLVEKARIEREMEVARDIQRSLLPTTDPSLAGFEIAGWNQSADATGGDFYDYLRLADGRLAIVLADVSGHGLGSSLLACESRALIRSAAFASDSLAAIMAQANDLLRTDMQEHRFVTMFLAALDASRDGLEYVGAGHTGLLCTHDGTAVSRVESTHPPLGLFPVFDIRAASVQLEHGDVLALLTDGFWEWENPHGEQFGIDRVSDVLRRNHNTSPAHLIPMLLTAVKEFASGVEQADDLTAVVIKRVFQAAGGPQTTPV